MRLIILDRDGVINEDREDYIKSPAEWQAIPGSVEAIARLNHAGYWVVIASNQSGLARGLFDISGLLQIQEKMHRFVADLGGHIEAVFFCPHGPDEGCSCRKPKPGLLLDIAARLHVELAGVPAVGDSLRDVQAARAAGARPVLLLTGKGAQTLRAHAAELQDVPVYRDLSALVDALTREGTP